MKKKMKTKRTVRKDTWAPFPQKDWQEWFSEFVLATLAVEFYGQNKTWPKKIKLGSVKVQEQKDGSAILSVDLQ